MNFEVKKDNFLISTNQTILNLKFTHQVLFESYWAKGIPFEVFEKSVKNSLCFGVFDMEKQIGFTRIVSDYSTFAYLGDLFIVEGHRGAGLSKWLLESLLKHPELQGLRRICLGSKDAQNLYRKFGFENLTEPENWMEIKRSDIYLKE